MVDIEVTGEVFEWRGPAPYYFLAVEGEEGARLRAVASSVSYGWGMVPVTVSIGEVTWTTSLWPKDGRYLLPLKDAARKRAGVALGDAVTAVLRTEGERTGERTDRADLVALVRRLRADEAVSEEQEEAWLQRFAAAVPHPRAIDLVLFPEVEVGEGATAEDIVDLALGYR